MEIFFWIAGWMTRRFERAPRACLVSAVIGGVLGLWVCWALAYERIIDSNLSFLAFGIGGALGAALLASLVPRKTPAEGSPYIIRRTDGHARPAHLHRGSRKA
jgi:hypothetical protein